MLFVSLFVSKFWPWRYLHFWSDYFSHDKKLWLISKLLNFESHKLGNKSLQYTYGQSHYFLYIVPSASLYVFPIPLESGTCFYCGYNSSVKFLMPYQCFKIHFSIQHQQSLKIQIFPFLTTFLLICVSF